MAIKDYSLGELIIEVFRMKIARLKYSFPYLFNGRAKLWAKDHNKITYVRPLSVTSMICNRSFFDAPFVQFWAEHLREKIVYHRKLWEFVYICQALYENGMLEEGKKGLGFGVGKEPLTSLFASMGCEILATDLDIEEAKKKGWVDTSQHVSSSYLELNARHICDKKTFLKRVKYKDVNMNAIPDELMGYDFCWSACALEHLGSIEKGLDFIKNSMKTLRPGGIAVHTTEFNLLSNKKTFDKGFLCIYRKRDIKKVIKDLEDAGHTVYPIDWHVGDDVVDNFIDLPPFFRKKIHLRLLCHAYPCTSIGLIVKKGTASLKKQ